MSFSRFVQFPFFIRSETLVVGFVIGALLAIVGKDWIISLFHRGFPRYAASFSKVGGGKHSLELLVQIWLVIVFFFAADFYFEYIGSWKLRASCILSSLSGKY